MRASSMGGLHATFTVAYRYRISSARKTHAPPQTRRARARLAHRPPDHGRARPARPPLGAAHPLGAAPRPAELPRAARAVRRGLAHRAEPETLRAARLRPGRPRAGRGLLAHADRRVTGRRARAALRLGRALGAHDSALARLFEHLVDHVGAAARVLVDRDQLVLLRVLEQP